jgi:hypothetical protein
MSTMTFFLCVNIDERDVEDTMGLAELLNIKATAAEPFARTLDMVALVGLNSAHFPL